MQGVNAQYEGPLSGITYTVRVYTSGDIEGQFEVSGVRPAWRRPVNNPSAIIASARPGDLVTVGLRGNEMLFGIMESIADPEVCE